MLDAAHTFGRRRLLFLGSSCIYPSSPTSRSAKSPADRAARADERGLRDRQDRRHRACPGTIASSTVARSSRRCRPTSTARTTTSTWPARTCCRRLIRKFHEGRERGHSRRDDVGHRNAATRVPARGRPGRGVLHACSSAMTRQSDQRRRRGGPHHPRARGARRARWSDIRARSRFDTSSPMERRARCSTSARSAPRLERPDRPAGRSQRPTNGTARDQVYEPM